MVMTTTTNVAWPHHRLAYLTKFHEVSIHMGEHASLPVTVSLEVTAWKAILDRILALGDWDNPKQKKAEILRTDQNTWDQDIGDYNITVGDCS